MKIEDITKGQTVVLYGTVEMVVPGNAGGSVRLRVPARVAKSWPCTLVVEPHQLEALERRDND